jgi:pimeloyl-ACP methyl ester carboxylesterase
MPFVSVATERDRSVDLFYQDIGDGDPVVLIHGWPSSSLMWESQIPAIVEAGRRVIAYDRRGFGRSSQPADGYTYDTLASDLNALMKELHLTNVTLAGFSMGGGEVARYIARYGTARLSKAILISSVTPYMMQTNDNPTGVPKVVLEKILDGVSRDRISFLDQFYRQFFNYGKLNHHGLTEEHMQYNKSISYMASPTATLECAKAWAMTDFRSDLVMFDIPTLVIHGDADQTVPFEVSGKIAADMIDGAQLEVIPGAPHGLFLTHTDILNALLVKFIES